jgi:hypothetical protein
MNGTDEEHEDPAYTKYIATALIEACKEKKMGLRVNPKKNALQVNHVLFYLVVPRSRSEWSKLLEDALNYVLRFNPEAKEQAPHFEACASFETP